MVGAEVIIPYHYDIIIGACFGAVPPSVRKEEDTKRLLNSYVSCERVAYRIQYTILL